MSEPGGEILTLAEVAHETGEAPVEVAAKLRGFEYPGRFVAGHWEVPRAWLTTWRAEARVANLVEEPNHRLFQNAEEVFCRLPGLAGCRSLREAPLPGPGGEPPDFLLVAEDRVGLVECEPLGREAPGLKRLAQHLATWVAWSEGTDEAGRGLLQEVLRPAFDPETLRGWMNLQKYPGGLGEWLLALGWDGMDKALTHLATAARTVVPILLVYAPAEACDRWHLREAVGPDFRGLAGHLVLPEVTEVRVM